jgi:hypothetical protein
VKAAIRVQADALLIESQAKRRLADEYDAARARQIRKEAKPKSARVVLCSTRPAHFAASSKYAVQKLIIAARTDRCSPPMSTKSVRASGECHADQKSRSSHFT